MKILHLMLANFFIDDYSYQENLLPKYHKKLGYDVEIVASLFNFDENGEGYYETGRKEYLNENGIPVTRLEYKKGIWNKKLRQYSGTYEALKKANPDIIFIHGCQFLDIKEVINYLNKKPKTKVFVDNHADFSNSARNWLSKNILHKFIWRRTAQKIEPFTTKFYGVLPARVNFLREIYKIPKEKTELLVMGADDEQINTINKGKNEVYIKNKFNIKDEDFLIVTGGKIDNAKRQVLNLMKIVQEMNNPKIKLLVYGSVIPDLKEEVFSMTEHDSIHYIGWINDVESYRLFMAADLVVFPGRHSVYWEQVVAIGTPMLLKFWKGTTHVDIGGNCIFLYDDTKEELLNKLQKIIFDKKLYRELKINATKNNKNNFLYSNIARKSLK